MKAKILVVEDQKIIALEITQRLQALGYEVAGTATSGNSAIEQATNLTPDLVLMDIKLEGNMDGIEAADRIRSLIGCPIIFLTAYADENTLSRAKITEPFGYMVKPLEERELRSSIEIALYKSKIDKGLKDSEARYRAIIKSLEVFLYIVDGDYNVLINNKQPDGLDWGVYKSNKKCYEEFYHNKGPCNNCPLPGLQDGSTMRTEIFDLNTTRYFYRISTPLKLSNNRNYYQHFLIDITEKKKSEEEVVVFLHEKDNLVKEVHQQFKNSLQFINNLISLSEKNTGEDQLKSGLQEIGSKIQCLSFAYEDINSDRGKNKLNFKNFAGKLLLHNEYILSLGDKKITLLHDIEDVSIPLEKAIPAGILLSELVINSCKKSLEGESSGKINVNFYSENGMFKLVVRDSGKSIYEDFNNNERTDMQVIKTLCENLRASAEVNYNNGNEFTAEFV